MADVDPAVIAARVQAAMGDTIAAGDAQVVSAVDAAVVYVTHQTGRAALPDDELTVRGLTGMAVRMLRDTDAVNSANAPVVGYDALYSPEDVYKHWRHYFLHIEQGWGVA